LFQQNYNSDFLEDIFQQIQKLDFFSISDNPISSLWECYFCSINLKYLLVYHY